MTLVDELKERGISLSVDGAELVVRGPQEALTEDVIERIRASKSQLMTVLAPVDAPHDNPAFSPEDGPATAEEIAQLEALGRRRKSGEIKAIRCGENGTKCYSCGGIPCIGSQPWGEAPPGG